MDRECIKYPLDEFLNEFPDLKKNKVEIYIDRENARDIIDFLRIEKNTKKFRIVLVEVLSLRYNDDLYRKEEVSEKAKHITAMKFARKENARIYCKEYLCEEDVKEKKVVMLYLYYKKEMKSKKLKVLLETLGGYTYEFSGQ